MTNAKKSLESRKSKLASTKNTLRGTNAGTQARKNSEKTVRKYETLVNLKRKSIIGLKTKEAKKKSAYQWAVKNLPTNPIKSDKIKSRKIKSENK